MHEITFFMSDFFRTIDGLDRKIFYLKYLIQNTQNNSIKNFDHIYIQV